MRFATPMLLAALAALATGCHTPLGSYVWFDQYRAAPKASAAYVVGVGDTITVRVYNQEAMSAKVKVRADGRISLPFLGDVEASGLPPMELSRKLQAQLKEYVVNPVVTVSLEETRPLEVYLIGEVVRPGRYALDPTATVLQALASAGGLTAFADRDRIFVLRRDPRPVRIRFRLESLTSTDGDGSAFRLLGGDTVVVE